MNYLSLFEGYGIELEYMLVDKNTLQILPIADKILTAAAGELTSDFEDGDITWSNELVLHVIELKTTGPAKSLKALETSFIRSLTNLRKIAAQFNCRLMPTAMHPLMNPATEMKLWPHGNNEIYESYNRIFDCRGHGWSNLQSMHINLPFANNDEFTRLHAAIRFILPILPALTASSPIVQGERTGTLDNRLVFYQQNQKRVPSISGQVIPENIHSIDEYHDVILGQIYRDIAPHDPEEMMREDWLNSRGAITRFERQTIEIRLLDLQECPSVDLAIANFVCAAVKNLCQSQSQTDSYNAFATNELRTIFDQTVNFAETAQIPNAKYLAEWGLKAQTATAGEIWQTVLATSAVKSELTPENIEILNRLLNQGSLASRITRAVGEGSKDRVLSVFRTLCDCLDNDQMFEAS